MDEFAGSLVRGSFGDDCYCDVFWVVDLDEGYSVDVEVGC